MFDRIAQRPLTQLQFIGFCLQFFDLRHITLSGVRNFLPGRGSVRPEREPICSG
jgi:hypothetical protein